MVNNIRKVYLDNNATTKVDERVIEYMNIFFRDTYAVASSQFSHTPGIKAKDAVVKSRNIIAESINAKADEIIFTSGATEANNLAIKGVAYADKTNRDKIIISSIEHFSVYQTAEHLRKDGYKVEYIKVDEEGFVDIEDLKTKIDEKTLLVSICIGNHEVGTIQDISSISEIVHSRGAYLHSDGAAAYLQTDIDVIKDNIDLLSITAHKIYGPKGVGALFVKKNIPIVKVFGGGFQEFDLRPGTENVPGIAGFGKAVEIYSKKDSEFAYNMRNCLYKELNKNIDGVILNGASDFSKRLCNNLNVSFEYIEGESVVLHLDMRGIAVITGSACFSRSLQASHILLAMGFSHERAHGSIRFSTSKYITKDDIHYTVTEVKDVIEKLRKLSPLI